MSEAIFTSNLKDSTPCDCDNCDWQGTAVDLDWISDVSLRLDPGSIVPAGECPKCGGLAYVIPEDHFSHSDN